MDPDSPEVEAEAVEIYTALTVERNISQGGYLACFNNNEDRNALRTWTGILMQGVSNNINVFGGALIFLPSPSGSNLLALTLYSTMARYVDISFLFILYGED